MKARRTAAVICPGRGTYTKTELGYLKRHRNGVALANEIDPWLSAQRLTTLSTLDGAQQFSPGLHTLGEHASMLIWACSMADFASIDREHIDIVAVTGNSMGWYSALAAAGAVRGIDAAVLVNTMGSMMKGGVVGGQLVYPVVDSETWLPDPQREQAVLQALDSVGTGEAFISIRFGGYVVIGGTAAAMPRLMKALPPVEEGRFPFALINHAAFHTPVLAAVSERALASLGEELFHPPSVPLVDGRGGIWQPFSTDVGALRRYTLDTQVVATYDFSHAVRVTLKEFAPDLLILLGPGSSTGGALGQILVREGWWGIRDKASFMARQEKDPVVAAMGREEQRALVVGHG